MPPIFAAASAEIALFFVELGIIMIVLALLARGAMHFGFSPIPLYLMAGLAFGQEGLLPVAYSKDFIEIGSEIGVILLLFMLGLEYSGDELSSNLRKGLPSGILDFVLSFTPGVVMGLLLEWEWIAALLLGGVTYVSSSGVISKLLSDLGWLGNRETPAILSILVLEDLVMAVYLPLMAVLLVGSSLADGMISLGIALVTVFVVMFIALRFGKQISNMVFNRSNEVVLLTTFALILLVAGLAQQLQVSAAVGAFLVGIALSEPVSKQAHDVITPVKDMFAAIFFVFFGLQINPSDLIPVMGWALILGFVTALTKVITGVWAARQLKVGWRGQVRAGVMLIPRGEFSIVIAGLAAAANLDEPQLAPLTAAYVLVLAIFGSIMARVLNPLLNSISNWRKRRLQAAGD